MLNKLTKSFQANANHWKHFGIAALGYLGLSALIYVAFTIFGAPFAAHQVLVQDESALERFWAFQTSGVVMLVEVGIILLITRGYTKAQRIMEKPQRDIAKKEMFGLLAYLAVVQVLGLVVGKSLGEHAVSFHLPGSLYGTNDAVSLGFMFFWAAFNFVAYAVIPIAYFMRKRKYNLRQLNVISNRNVWRDSIIILVVLAMEVAIQLGGFSDALLRLPLQQAIEGSLLAFSFNLFGTAIPAAIFIYALLFPRYQAVFKSSVTVIILGGLTYMAVHLFDNWMVFTSVGAIITSFGALFLQYFMPGVIKSVLTQRTGNPWVHLWAYHAIAPHVILDAPQFVDTLHQSGESMPHKD